MFGTRYIFLLTVLSVFSTFVACAANGLQKRGPSYCTVASIEDVFAFINPTFCTSYLGILTSTTTSTVRTTTTFPVTTTTPTVTTTTTITTVTGTTTMTTTNEVETDKRKRTLPARIPIASVLATMPSTLLASACSCIATVPTFTSTITDTCTVTTTATASTATTTASVTIDVGLTETFALIYGPMDGCSVLSTNQLFYQNSYSEDSNIDAIPESTWLAQCQATCLETSGCTLYWIDSYYDAFWECFGFSGSLSAFQNSGDLVCGFGPDYNNGQLWSITDSY